MRTRYVFTLLVVIFMIFGLINNSLAKDSDFSLRLREGLYSVDDVRHYILGTDAETGVNYWYFSRQENGGCWKEEGKQYKVFGAVSQVDSLLNDDVARRLITKGLEMAMLKCKSNIGFKIYLVPAKYKAEYKVAFGKFGPVLVNAVGYANGKITDYENHVLIEEQERLRLQQEKLRLEQEKINEEKKKDEVRKRYDEFVKKYGVKEFVSGYKLETNPFIYEGKTIAINLTFEEMLTATQGIFRVSGDNFLVVSNIPKGLFTSVTNVVLAGRVIGKTEVEMGLKMSIPHLKFIGVHFCKDYGCRDLLP